MEPILEVLNFMVGQYAPRQDTVAPSIHDCTFAVFQSMGQFTNNLIKGATECAHFLVAACEKQLINAPSYEITVKEVVQDSHEQQPATGRSSITAMPGQAYGQGPTLLA
jgi:hypothetical protein